jgi:signal transduction histidine kinase
MAFENEIRNSRILIVDDVVANLTLLENVLNRMGYKQIKRVTDTAELIPATLEWQPDLVVVELPRADSSRLTAVEQLRAKVRSQYWIPILVLSTDADHELRRKAFAAGVSEFLAKPFDFSELVVRIRNSLLMRTYQEQLRNQNRILEYRVAARTKSLAERTEQLERTLAELKSSQQQIIQHERLRAFGAMAGGVAHDFNNVLMCVIGYTELLLNDPALLANTEKTRKFLRSMNTAGLDASSIVARLRNFYRPLEEGDVFTPTDLNSLVAEIIPLTQPKWKTQALAEGRTIEVELDLQPVPQVACNPAEIREVVVNLVFNAADAMPKGGKITLCTRCEGAVVSIGIRDTGTGMSEEVRQRCMEPFFSTKGEKGTGLGLAMVFGIVKRHEGIVEIESEVGHGTVFWIRLSRDLEARGFVESDAVESVEPLHILVVDDEPVARDILSLYLAAEGHSVEMAINGYGALDKFRKEQFDLVITDQAMPGLTGLQLAEAIKKEANTPILMLTGYGIDPLEAGVRKVVDTIVNKPISQRELRSAIARTIQRPQSVGIFAPEHNVSLATAPTP